MPALERTMRDGTTRLVKFDGVDGDSMIDSGIWEISTQSRQRRAVKMLKELNVTNIQVKYLGMAIHEIAQP